MFKDQTVWVTGASSGIGEALSLALARQGARLILSGRKVAELERVATACGGGNRHTILPFDTTDYPALPGIVADAWDRAGGIDVLVNNAGTNPFYGNIADSEKWAWDKTLDLNLTVPYVLSIALGNKMMANGGGSILNIASVAGLRASTNQGIYSVTKCALVMLTKVLARDMGHGGVRANAILPGLIKTELSRALWEDEDTLARVVKSAAAGRIGHIDELIGAAVFLSSEAGSYTSGAVIQVDGGMVI